MLNQLIPTEEIEMLVSELNALLDVLEVQVTESISKEHTLLFREKKQEIDLVQRQSNKLQEAVSRHRSISRKKHTAFVVQPKYSV